MDNELFEVCKKVYKTTGWSEDHLEKWFDGSKPYIARYGTIPLYNSDYLLEKLPKMIVGDHGDSEGNFWLALFPTEDGWSTFYALDGEDYHTRHGVKGDTPLKALLKLTRALAEAGELK